MVLPPFQLLVQRLLEQLSSLPFCSLITYVMLKPLTARDARVPSSDGMDSRRRIVKLFDNLVVHGHQLRESIPYSSKYL